VDYTYQVARGSASDPAQARNALANGSLPEVQLTPLSWDQRNTLNVTASYAASDWGGSLILQYGSGAPYTPRAQEDITTLLTNSQTKPSFMNLDLQGYYQVRFDPVRFVLFARVFNLLDTRNELNVFDDTGRAGYTLDYGRAALTNPRQRVNSLTDYYRRPTHYSEPRRIEVGLNVEF
jgi:hypothetical protein